MKERSTMRLASLDRVWIIFVGRLLHVGPVY
jgi:hypothetical protein